MNKISVIIKRPGQRPYHTHISGSLEALQLNVGGPIEHVSFCTDLGVICNEEGRIDGMPYNCNVCGIDFYGPIIFVGQNMRKAEFTDLPCDFATFKNLFKNLFEED